MSGKLDIKQELGSWTRNHYHAFLLVWAAHADLKVSEEEKLYIKGKVGTDEYHWAEGRFQNLSDFEVIQLISQGRELFYPADIDKTRLQSELRTLFSADHEWNSLEDQLIKAISKVL